MKGRIRVTNMLNHNHNFVEIKKQTLGMCAPEHYESIYFAAIDAPVGNMIEVGTGLGAGTISLALGIKDTKKEGHIFTFDNLKVGSRLQYGTPDDNAKIIEENFKVNGVTQLITPAFEDVESSNFDIVTSAPYAHMLLDADGNIDRDFEIFYNYLKPGAIIIIDDYGDKVKVNKLSKRNYRFVLKHKLTYHLVQYFIDQGLLINQKTVGGMFFGKKPEHIEMAIDFSTLRPVTAYRKLVFTEYTFPSKMESLKRKILTYIEKHPKLHHWLRKVKTRIRNL